MNIVNATPTGCVWNVGGTDFATSRSLVQAAIAAHEHDEITVHGAVGLLSIDELKSLLVAMDDAWDARMEKRRERRDDFSSNWSA